MKESLQYRGSEVWMKCIEMSHSSVGGEYEMVLSEEVEFDLHNLWHRLRHAGYELEDLKARSLKMVYNKALITVLKGGRILIQDLLPDTPDEAMRIGKEIVNAEQES